MKRSLAVIGAGASALASLYAYIVRYDDALGMPDTIFVFEKSGTFGPGIAYEQDLHTNILNTKTGYITPFYDRPGDFYSWLVENEVLWRRLFPEFDLDKDGYAPRSLFGMYLQSRFAWLVKLGATKGIKVIQLHAEVIDILPVGDGYAIFTHCNLSVTTKYILLACGTLPAEAAYFGETPETVFHNPYPLESLCQRIPKDASVAILGARLSCIDTVIGLISEGHIGNLTVHSRSGYFPSVRGTQGRITPKTFTADSICELVNRKGALELRDIAKLAIAEIAAQGADAPSELQIPSAPTDIVKFLEEEITAAERDRIWQAVLYSTNTFIGVIWNALCEKEKSKLINEFFSVFMSYRVSFPPENARLLLSYFQSGKVGFVPGRFSTRYADTGQKHVITTADGSEHYYDYIVWATGSPRDARHLDSLLIQNLLARGIVSAHPFGGLRVEEETHKVIDRSDCPVSAIRLVGELSNGQFFFTSALEILVNHSRRCIDQFASEFEVEQVPPQRLQRGSPR